MNQRFQVKVSRKGKKRDSKLYNPVARNSGEAQKWGDMQAQESFGAEGVAAVIGKSLIDD